jgi:hypothetical protein
MGRFWTPDPSSGSNAANPSSWNKYAYVHGDPVNFNDPQGMLECMVGWMTCDAFDVMWDLARMSGSVGGNPNDYAAAFNCIFYRPGCLTALDAAMAASTLGVAALSLTALEPQLKAAASQQSIFSAEQLDCISGIETGRTWNQSIVANNGRVGLFQFDKNNWDASGTAIPWNNGSSAKDPLVAAEVALALLYRKLGSSGVQNPTDTAVQRAIDNFGEGDGRYGQAVMDCAKQLQSGDFLGAYNTLQSYANWVAGGRK